MDCISPMTFVISILIIFALGILAGRQQGKEICTKKVHTILAQYGFKHDDENNGDA